MIAGSTSCFEAVKTMLMALFTEDYIMSHSISGKKTTMVSNDDVKNPYNPKLYNVMTSLVKEKFPGTKTSDITPNVHALQRSILRKKNKLY